MILFIDKYIGELGGFFRNRIKNKKIRNLTWKIKVWKVAEGDRVMSSGRLRESRILVEVKRNRFTKFMLRSVSTKV